MMEVLTRCVRRLGSKAAAAHQQDALYAFECVGHHRERRVVMALLVAAQAAHGRFPDEQTFVLCEPVEQGQILDPCVVGVAVRFACHTFVSPSEALQRLLMSPVSQQTHGAFTLRTEGELSSELVQFEATVTGRYGATSCNTRM
jgi:hypothetical protein